MRREHQGALLKVSHVNVNLTFTCKCGYSVSICSWPLLAKCHTLMSMFFFQLEEKCRLDMEAHRKTLDTEYENLLQQFSKELEKLQARHQQELDRKVKRFWIYNLILFKSVDWLHILFLFYFPAVKAQLDG